MHFSHIAFTAGAILSGIASWPQIIKVIRTKDVEDLSFYFLLLILISTVLRAPYFFHHQKYLPLLSLVIVFINFSILLGLYFYYGGSVTDGYKLFYSGE